MEETTFTVKELAEYLPDKPHENTIRNWTHKKLIPFHKVSHHKNSKLYFKKSEIDKWQENDRKV